MDRFDLEGAGACDEVPRVRRPRMARGQDEPLPLWHDAKMRRPANAAKLMRATVDEAISSPVATDPARGDASFACAVAKATPTKWPTKWPTEWPTEWRCDWGARGRPVAEICFERCGQPKGVVANLAGGACSDAAKGTRVRA